MDGNGTKTGPDHAATGKKPEQAGKKQMPSFRPLMHIDARLMSLLDMAADSIVLMDAQSRILLFNKASETLFGYKSEEVIGKGVRILMPPKYSLHHDRWVGNYLKTGEHSIIGIGREVQGMHKDGTTFPFDLSVGVADTDDGKQFIGVMRDLRARKEVEARLRTLQAELNQMTRINTMDEMGATIAHELNQPLTAIILYLQAIERKLGSSDEANPLTNSESEQLTDLSRRAVEEAQRTSSLLQRIRSIIEKNEPERVPCDIYGIITRARELAKVGFAATDVDITIECAQDSKPDRLPMVMVDPVQIEQIILNLMRNAFQAMRGRDHKAIHISLSEAARKKDRGPRLLVQFKDNGPGIPEANRASLFKAFDASRRNGMGLGLAIARSIAQNHGGSLELAPFDDTQTGACFILALPIASPQDQLSAKSETFKQGQDYAKSLNHGSQQQDKNSQEAFHDD